MFLRLGQENYNMNLEHLAVSESKKMLKRIKPWEYCRGTQPKAAANSQSWKSLGKKNKINNVVLTYNLKLYL